MNRPVTIVGTPCRTSSATAIARPVRERLPANSVKYRPVRMPSGAAISAPIMTISSVPSSELKIPPPASPPGS